MTETGDGGRRAIKHVAAGLPISGTPPRGRLIVTTEDLTKDYGGNGLFGVDLAVPLGCVYGLVGLNGAGKTTLVSILSATRQPSAGRATLTADRRRVAVCPDVPDFEPWLTAWEVVDLARSLAPLGQLPG